MADAYVPGVCNINHAEIAYRRKAALFGLGLFIIVAVALFALGANRWIRLVLFVPAFVAVIGYLQTKNKFCVSYAASGQQNATDGNKAAEKITDDGAHAKDVAKARKMNTQAAVVSVLVTAIMVII